jgi:predicted O-methyltransferase YrrM
MSCLFPAIARNRAGANWTGKGGRGVSFESLISEVYDTRKVHDALGVEYELNAEVDRAEGQYLLDLVSSHSSIVKTLEVGCAYGLSSLFICEGLRNRPGASHTIIDPSQTSVWHDVGVSQLQRFGYDFFNILRVPSELALPQLLLSQSEQFDLVFIDGWHTFDQTMLDMYYASRLVRVGGYIVTDDCNWPSVAAAMAYYTNYPMFETIGGFSELRKNGKSLKRIIGRSLISKIPPNVAQWIMPAAVNGRVYRMARFPSMVALKKIAPDARNWEWYENF